MSFDVAKRMSESVPMVLFNELNELHTATQLSLPSVAVSGVLSAADETSAAVELSGAGSVKPSVAEAVGVMVAQQQTTKGKADVASCCTAISPVETIA